MSVTHSAYKHYSTVNLYLQHIECEHGTKEIDKDEIVLAGIKVEGKVVSESGKTKLEIDANGKQIDLGQFKKGTAHTYSSPKLVAQFTLGLKELKYPQYYPATVILIEKDEGNIGEIVNAAIASIEKELPVAAGAAATAGVIAAAAAAGITGAVAGSVVPLVGTAIGTAVASTTALALAAIKNARKDDVIQAKDFKLQLDHYPTKAGTIAESSKTFTGEKAIYKANFLWTIEA